jgi:transglutaminase-like putative cysteine protease
VKSKDSLANYQKNVFWGNEKTIQVEADSIAWGQQALRSLNLESLSSFEKTQKICTYLNENFRFNFQRSLSIREIIEKKGSNCVSHSLMGIFLLRLAGIPAKFAHEVHLSKQFRLISLYVGI